MQLFKVLVVEHNALLSHGKEQLLVLLHVVEVAELVERGCCHGQLIVGKPVGHNLLAVLLCLAVVAAQDGLYLAFGLGCRHEVDP